MPMALAEITQSRTRRAKSAAEVMETLMALRRSFWVRLVVWMAFCVCLIVFG